MSSDQLVAQIDEQLREIERSVEAPDQRAIVAAMLYEQLRLRINMDLLVQQLRGEAAALPR